jgi:hypothetical protein
MEVGVSRRFVNVIAGLVVATSVSLVPLFPAVANSAENAKAPLYPEQTINGVNQDPGFCFSGAAPSSQTNGFIIVHRDGNTLHVNFHLEGASPNATYQMNQSCVAGNVATLTTNPTGVGNADFSYAIPSFESNFVFDACQVPCGTPNNTYYASGLVTLP